MNYLLHSPGSIFSESCQIRTNMMTAKAAETTSKSPTCSKQKKKISILLFALLCVLAVNIAPLHAQSTNTNSPVGSSITPALTLLDRSNTNGVGTNAAMPTVRLLVFPPQLYFLCQVYDEVGDNPSSNVILAWSPVMDPNEYLSIALSTNLSFPPIPLTNGIPMSDGYCFIARPTNMPAFRVILQLENFPHPTNCLKLNATNAPATNAIVATNASMTVAQPPLP
jgi:hypothetical protein